METRELLDLLEKMYEIKVVGLSKLARALNISYNKLYVFLNSLKRKGFTIIPCMNLRFIDLEIIMVLSDNRIFGGNECQPLFPQGHFTLLMIPASEESKIETILRSLLGVRKTYLIKEAQLPKPLLVGYQVNNFGVLEGEKIWERLLKIMDFISNVEAKTSSDVEQLQAIERHRISEIDLKIMREITLNPFISSKRLAEKLGITVGKLRRHITTRIEPLMKGYRVLWAPYYKRFTAVLFTVMRTSYIPQKTFYELLSEFPLSVLTAHNPNEKIVVNAWLVNSRTYDIARRYMRVMEQRYGIEVLDSWGYLFSSDYMQIIPCKALVEYDKKKRRLILRMSTNIFNNYRGHLIYR